VSQFHRAGHLPFNFSMKRIRIDFHGWRQTAVRTSLTQDLVVEGRPHER
jgi:hypothetical protein